MTTDAREAAKMAHLKGGQAVYFAKSGMTLTAYRCAVVAARYALLAISAVGASKAKKMAGPVRASSHRP